MSVPSSLIRGTFDAAYWDFLVMVIVSLGRKFSSARVHPFSASFKELEDE